MKAIIIVALITVYLTGNSFISAKYIKGESDPFHWWDTNNNNDYKKSDYKRIPFPQCLLSKYGSSHLNPDALQKLFDKQLRAEEYSLKQDSYSNYDKDSDASYDYDSSELRRGSSEGRTTARAAIKVTRDILTVLMCDLSGTSSNNLQSIFDKFKIPNQFCSYLDKPSCDSKSLYRTITGVCNNLEHPYYGSSQTAFSRLLPAAYEDSLSEPRRKSVKGGYLPSCRHISLNLDSRPIFDRKYNNFFVTFGQFIGHDVALSVPVSDTYSRPISTCTCGDKYDWDKCNVIPISPDDPYLRSQKCMAFPATAQAFKNQICSLGVKELMNGNTHYIDLSTVYGSTVKTAEALRSEYGLLKSTRPQWSTHELPPGQREGKSCTDSNHKRKCFAGGDSRLMITLAFTGVHTMFLRWHNQLARQIRIDHPTFDSKRIYEEARALNIAFFQRYVYAFYLPILLGEKFVQDEFGGIERTQYDPNVEATIDNEFSTAAFRLHSMVRDLFTRCTYDAKTIDYLWLHDIHHKSKYAYDAENNGLDSILCGLFYDMGFAYDGDFAHQIRNRLFESESKYNNLWRNDLVSINICRGREHGIPSYNELLKFCNLPKAESFSDFIATMNFDGMNKLKYIYRAPDDVDAFIGITLETPINGGILGHVGSCIVTRQFKKLRDGDRFFYSHTGALSESQFDFVAGYPIHCFVCRVVRLESVPKNPFVSFNEKNNPLVSCSECDNVAFKPPVKILPEDAVAEE